jgi:hypothetical protein
MMIGGDNGSLTATVNTPNSGYSPLNGTGSDTRLTLNGQFPFLDNAGDPTSSTDNSSTISLTNVMNSKSAAGTFTGAAKNRFNERCTTSNGTIQFSQ